MTARESFEKSFQYFLDHEDQLITTYRDKVIAIYLNKVLGVYESTADAYFNVPKEKGIEPGSFVIKNCSANDPYYVRVFHANSDLT